MGKVNKKLTKPKIITKPSDETTKIKGPFPIYRSTPVQLNGPEPASFKIVDGITKTKATEKRTQQVEKPQSKSQASTDEPEDSTKTKKLRKLAISRLTKKEKKQFRKEEMLKKVELTKQAFKQDKARKTREQTVITGDLRPLLDALPSLESLYEVKSSVVLKTGVPKYDKKAEPKTKRERRAQNFKENKRKLHKRFKTLKNVMNEQSFKKDPKKVIADHIKNTRREQLELLMKNVA
uniref:Uncharacterized protein n=1 Tax=Anopheles farauti TaxID=69004 RepID=A0A182QG46_9DIPT